jgi:hypothetical protein
LFTQAVLVDLTCPLETRRDEIKVPLRRGNTAGGLLLEAVQHINCLGKADRVDGSVRSTSEVLDDLHDDRTVIPPERLRVGVLLVDLGKVEGMPDRILDVVRELLLVGAAGANPDDGFHALPLGLQPQQLYSSRYVLAKACQRAAAPACR